MRIKNGAPALGLLLLAMVAPLATATQEGPPSAEGSVRLPAGAGGAAIEFSASLDAEGFASGRMRFTGEGDGGPAQDVDGVGGVGPRRQVPGHLFEADFDCLEVARNTAVMSGVITESAQADYVGRRVFLVVVDSGGGQKAGPRDRLTWAIHRRDEETWTASDAEAESDPGVGRSWVATDAEREDDAGRPSWRGEPATCKNLPLSSLSLIELKEGEGEIRVRP